jgi:dolichol-phosphate mannosyltransferase
MMSSSSAPVVFTPELSVVIPTFNERDNLVPLLASLDHALSGIAWEVIIVDDDSPDGTSDIARELARQRFNLHVIQRIGRRGLASACTEGMMASAAPYLMVLDADQQHDTSLIPRMLDVIRTQPADIVVGSRHVEGGDVGNFTVHRKCLSSLGGTLARLLLRTGLSDPMSGFFLVRAPFFHQAVHNMSNIGFKILLDLVVSSPVRPRVVELPYRFGERMSGESKLGIGIGIDYIELLVDKTIGRLIPLRFIIFVMVGLFGVVVHLSALSLLFVQMGIQFYWSQAFATLFAMTVNFVLNNRITYRDRRLSGMGFVWGLVSFYAACGIGAIINFQVAEMLFSRGVYWLIAGFLGAAVGSVWNYGVTSTLTWRKKWGERTIGTETGVKNL